MDELRRLQAMRAAFWANVATYRQLANDAPTEAERQQAQAAADTWRAAALHVTWHIGQIMPKPAVVEAA